MIERRYWALYRIRRVEEEIARVYPTDKIKSPVHLSIGQEAVSVGVCEALSPGDVAFGSYRSHALYLAKGGNLNAMIAELYGKQTGSNKGKGGSMHLADVKAGLIASSAVVGTTIPNGAGYAYAFKLRKQPHICAAFFGDGATDEGVFWETVNFAALKQLPLLFVCENNGYAIHSRFLTRQPGDNLVERVKAFKIPAERIADNDVDAFYERASAAVKSIRAGGGPVFLECMTYRWREHVGPNDDYKFGYRHSAEAEPWIKNDPMLKLAAKLDPETRRKIESEVEQEIKQAFLFAEESPWPESKELYTHLFKED